MSQKAPSSLPRRVPGPIVAVLAAVGAIFTYGLIHAYRNPLSFREWIGEDRLAEWLTFGALVLCSVYSFAVASGFGREGNRPARRAWFIAAGIFLFGALEEISYGQRIFGWESPAWFVEHNDQHETGLHNLIVFGVKLNKLVFGKLLAIGLIAYFVGFPILYRRSERFRAWADSRGAPIPRLYQIVYFAVSAGLIQASLKVAKKIAELQELAGAFVFVAILFHPLNWEALPPRVPFFGRLGRAWRAASGAAVGAFRRLPGTLRFFAAVVGLELLAFTAFRGLFWSVFEPTAVLPDGATLLRSWYLGFRFDLRLALVLALPAFVLSCIPPLHPARSRMARRLWLGYLAVTGFLAFFAYGVDIGHYAYVGERLNASVVDHLQALDIAVRMVWETYAVVPIVLGVVGLSVAYAFALRRFAFAELGIPAQPLGRGSRAAVIAGTLVGIGLGLFGKLSWYPLRWSDAFFTTNAFASSLGLNPVHHLFDTLHVAGEEPYDEAAVREHYDVVAAYLGVERPDRERLVFDRRVPAPVAPRLPRRPSFVIVFLESFAAFKVGATGNSLDPTPHFDALARRSIFYPYFYVPCGPTAPSIFTTLFGIHDVNQAGSASRNPVIVRQRTLVNALEGYDKLYFIGGSAAWGNIRAMLCHNIPGLRLYEEGSYQSPRNDTWGISDLHLFDEANAVLRVQPADRPFIAFIQTAGNHRPYTIPDDRRGFEPRAIDETRARAAGFESLESYNGIRFMDHAIGEFLKSASREAYFGSTVFLLFGDHGTTHTAAADLRLKQLVRHHVPFAIYAPGFFSEGRVVEEVASSLDVLPTVAGLASVPYVNSTFGRDLLAPREPGAPRRYALIDEQGHRGLLDEEHYYTVHKSGAQALLPYRSRNPAEDFAARYPERVAEMARLCRGLHETARYLLYHNRPRD